VDAELSSLAGPQLVVPVLNARFALNAANARWGSLYDALYGTDAIPQQPGADRGGEYDPARGARVIAFGRDFLDRSFPLADASHADATGYRIEGRALVVDLADGRSTALQSPGQLRGHTGDAGAPDGILLRNHGLHVEIQFDAQDRRRCGTAWSGWPPWSISRTPVTPPTGR